MENTTQTDPNANFSTPARRARRKIAREIAAAYDALLRAAGFEPIERRTAWAIECRLYELDSQDPTTPRRISLSSIGAALTSRSDAEKARADRAREHAGHLFNHAIPKTGYQILTRYKAPEDSGSPHEYGSHAMPVAEILAELHAEERAKILADRAVEKKGQAIEDKLEQLATEALELLPRCEVEILDPNGESYAYVSAPEAKAYCKTHEEFSSRAYAYTPPPTPEEKKSRKPLSGADFDRLKDRAIRQAIDSVLDEIVERNSFEEARLFLRVELLPALNRAAESWTKVEGGRDRGGVEQQGFNYRGENGGYPSGFGLETEPATPSVPPPKNGGVSDCNPADINDLQDPIFETCENYPSGSINFDTALEAAIFAVEEGWHVLPICNFNPDTGHCTASWHPATCTGKVPLVKGKGNPGDGYTAASRELAKVRHWFETKYPDAGLGLRLDDKILIDGDLKDGGPASYRIMADTFDLPETLTQITQSGGDHHVFKLPEGLPDAWLKSWTRIGDTLELGGLDIKVGVCGLMYAEPTRGPKGFYRWADPYAEIATLPRDVCDLLHEARYKGEEQKTEKTKAARVYSSDDPLREFDPDQEKYFRDVAVGDRHKRLFSIAVAISKQTGAGAEKIKKALNTHAAKFSTPLDDSAWIDRVAATLGGAQ